jgi:hypothetical protein
LFKAYLISAQGDSSSLCNLSRIPAVAKRDAHVRQQSNA